MEDLTQATSLHNFGALLEECTSRKSTGDRGAVFQCTSFIASIGAYLLQAFDKGCDESRGQGVRRGRVGGRPERDEVRDRCRWALIDVHRHGQMRVLLAPHAAAEVRLAETRRRKHARRGEEGRAGSDARLSDGRMKFGEGVEGGSRGN